MSHSTLAQTFDQAPNEKRVHSLLASIISLSLLTIWAGAPRAAKEGSNVLLIMTDDLGYGDLYQRHTHNYYPEFLFRNDQRIPLDVKMVNNERGDFAGYATGRTLYSQDLLTTEAVQFIDRQNASKPFLFSSL